ncbi:hypothetical protein [Streptomyces iconiensis]|uniref:DUF4287 domain-containing protein n=1 Tax=Streptomyces iconiensis TaxID=1384038 RepID=A0ABT6ZQS3_9ACTN|nr:hypothetical protein [Streptomyces iconiensis]MDJ1131369.1 hypothetical protein [Streptomyces iconiensis]
MNTGSEDIRKVSDEALRAATSRDWDGWFALLDAWGAGRRSHTQIATHLREEHGVNGWHAQSIAVGYQRERGMRAPGQQSDGDFKSTASKTVGASAERVSEAFTSSDIRERWLPGAGFTVRSGRPGRTLSADWGEDGAGGRISVFLTPKSETRTQISLSHGKLPDTEAVEHHKAFWREALGRLKAELES